MDLRRGAFFFFLIAFFATCYGNNQSAPEDLESTPSSQEPEQVARSINEFGHNLILKMLKEKENSNIVLSPTSLAGLLAMTLLGSVGTTYDEMAKALGFSQDLLENRKNHEQFGDLLRKLNEYKVSNSNKIEHHEITDDKSNNTEYDDVSTRTVYADAIVVDKRTRIRNIYREYIERVYHGEVLAADFGDTIKSQQLVNDWVKKNTNGKVEDFLKEPVPVNTKIVLLSALYFSGQWQKPFSQEYTLPMSFDRPSGSVMTDLMLNFGRFSYGYNLQSGIHMLALPYNDSSTTMYVVKPLAPKKTTLAEVMAGLNYTFIDEMINNLTIQMCIIRFPKMDLKTKVNLKDGLKSLGMNSIFSPSDANFALMVDSNNPEIKIEKEKEELLTRIYSDDEKPKNVKTVIDNLPNPGVYVDSILHDVRININEYGTEAVAASSGFLSRTATQFYVDSPFYMFIRNERTKLVTFSAVIYDPTSELN